MQSYIVLGSGSGIGAELARMLAGPGVCLLLHTGRNVGNLSAVADTCRAAGAEVETCLGLTGEAPLFDAVSAWLGAVEGGLTGFVFAAGYAKRGTIDDTTPEALSDALMAMPQAFHRMAQIVAPHLRDKTGRMLCVSAFGAHRTKTHSFAPTAPAKAALEAQVRVFAANLAPRGISVNAVVPGYVEKEPGTPSSLTAEEWAAVTAGIPMGRVGRRREIAALGKFLLSEDAGYITGQSLHVNGGLTL
ncbi:SDR family NAD(P)-dependent oxidoreductase [Salipiger abyssi]|uniref:SDR family NAD(P)-dependent oxidoreductase n=1 Tax=Salipiger abyssi TaxID=1250539 RepID=UPI001A8D0E41|nr:SDR family oxidoreductase [Salipiger abyssi]MBN9885852.1 SDR family oxidoreductase [Salipiger abyssi]